MTFSVLSNDFGDKFGFTEKEIIHLLEDYKMEDKLDDLREWYNGYRIGESTVYNPWSILTCVYKKGFLDAYWVNTSANELLKRLVFKKGSDSMKENLEKLLRGESIVKSVEERMIFEYLDNNHADSMWMLLLFSGYLTLASPSLGEGNQDRALKIPNRDLLDIVMELKKAPSHNVEDLESTAESALRQIEEKKYGQLLNDRGIKQKLAIGLAFYGKHSSTL